MQISLCVREPIPLADQGSRLRHRLPTHLGPLALGPASLADKDIAIVKWQKGLDGCQRLMEADTEELVKEAMEQVGW